MRKLSSRCGVWALVLGVIVTCSWSARAASPGRPMSLAQAAGMAERLRMAGRADQAKALASKVLAEHAKGLDSEKLTAGDYEALGKLSQLAGDADLQRKIAAAWLTAFQRREAVRNAQSIGGCCLLGQLLKSAGPSATPVADHAAKQLKAEADGWKVVSVAALADLDELADTPSPTP